MIKCIRVIVLTCMAMMMTQGSELYRIDGVSASDTLSIREKPDKTSKKTGDLPYNFSGISIDRCIKIKSSPWCEVIGNFGWLAGNYLKKTDQIIAGDQQYQGKKYHVIKHHKGEFLNVRKGIGTQYEITGKLPYNAENILVQTCLRKKSRSPWCFVIKLPDQISNFMIGWVSGNYIAEVQTEQKDKKIKAIAEINANALKAYTRKEYNTSIQLYKKSLKLVKEVYGEVHYETALSYQDLGTLFYSIGDYENAEKYYKKTMDIVPDVCSSDDILYIQILANYANLKGSTNHYKEAETFYNVLLMLLKKSGDQETSYSIYINMADMYERAGIYPKTIEYMKKAIEIKEAMVGRDDPKMAASYVRMGNLYARSGTYDLADKYYHKALKMYRDTKEVKSLSVVENNLGLLYLGIGDNIAAVAYFEKALEYYKKNHQDKSLEAATIYNNLGLGAHKHAQYKKALEYHQKAYEIRKSILADTHPDMAMSYHNLASTYDDLGDIKNAEEFYTKALQTRIKILGEYNSDTAYTYAEFGAFLLANNQSEKALTYLKKAAEIREKILGIKDISLIRTYAKISDAYFDKDDYNLSYAYSKKAMESYFFNQESIFPFLTPLQKINYLKENDWTVDHYLQNALFYLGMKAYSAKSLNDIQPLYEEILRNWLRHKGSILESENAITTLYENTTDAKLKQKIDTLRSTQRAYATLMQQPPKSDFDSYQKQLKTLEDQIHILTQAIAQKAASFKQNQALKQITSEELATTLQENELYIDYAKTGELYYLFTLDHASHITFSQIDANRSQQIDTLIEAFRTDIKTLSDKLNTLDAQTFASYSKSLTPHTQKILSKLYELLIPKHFIKNKQHLIISPDGALRLLPFGALYDKDNRQYLIETKEIRYTPSGKELLRAKRYNTSSDTTTKSVVFADPDYNNPLDTTNNTVKQQPTTETPSDTNIRSISSGFEELPYRFERLEGTRKEAQSIQRLIPSTVQVYLDQEANQAHLFGVQQPKILHLATHGFYLHNQNIINPMLKSGIILAGAGIARVLHQDEGIITALKLSGMDLKGTELVVLSACETGTVDAKDTESISGLNKAFVQAGAQTVMSTLWSVADQQSAQLMEHFYQERFTGDHSYAQALKRAKQALIAKGLHPYLWAAFVLVGNR